MFRWDSHAVHRAECNPETGLYRFKHRDRKTLSEFGVVNGRLRLRTSRVLQHITAVIGDPEWTDARALKFHSIFFLELVSKSEFDPPPM